MSMTARMCRIDSCGREAVTFCYHCQLDVCCAQFTQLSSMMMTDVYALADEINTLTDNMTTSPIDQLQQWRDKSITLVEQVYKQKQVEKQKEISEIKEKITKLIDYFKYPRFDDY